MGFINWQNLKKYIRRGTDSEVARIGHVNAVYNALKGGGPVPTVLYHEVIGTITFPDSINTDNPTLEIVVCNTTGEGSADWSIVYQSTGSGYEYVLSFAGSSTLYNNGVLITTPLQGSGTSGPYHLLPLGDFGGFSISIAFVEDYISGSTIRRRVVDINDNVAASFNFHLILPINNS